MEMNGIDQCRTVINLLLSNGNGANMEQLGKREIAKVFVCKALAIIVM